MADAHKSVATRHLRMLFDVGTVARLTDGQLLDMFVARRDEAAFTALIERHGPMVQRVCHEILRNHHDAQDALQATFLVLASRASSIRRRDSVASWLYGVALRVGSCTRSAAARRRRLEHDWAVRRPATCDGDGEILDRHDLDLHAELSQLSERFRAPVILCYLEGRTYEEAAQVLQCPVGTIKSRLATARERLRRRLARLEKSPTAGPAALLFEAAPRPAAVPPELIDMTIQEVVRNTAKTVAATPVAKLAREVVKTMLLYRLSARVGILFVFAALVTTAVGRARSVTPHAVEIGSEADGIILRPATGEPPSAPPELQTAKRPTGPRSGVPIDLAGRVVDEKDRPVPDADVRVRLFRSNVRGLRISSEVVDAWSARTDSLGRYRVKGVQGIESDDYQHLAIDVIAPNQVEFCERYFTDLAGAATKQGNLADVKLRSGVAVTGRCIDPAGKPVAGAKIHAMFAREPMSSLGRTHTTDADGRFRLNIPEGHEAELIVYPRTWAPHRVSVSAGGGDVGDIKLEAGVELVGRLVRTGDQPGAGKVIAFESTDRGQFGSFPITLVYKTDHDGNFHVPAVKGAFKVWTTKAHDSGPDDSGPVVCDGPIPAVLPQIMIFDPRSVTGRQEFVVQTRPEISFRGTITAPDGKPVRGVCLWLVAGIGDDRYLAPIRWTTTDSNGRYALSGIPRGLTKAFLTVFAEPPDRQTYYDAIASGSFQGQAHGGSVTFELLERDQDPLDFRLKLETLPSAAPPKIVTAEDKELDSLGEEAERLQQVFSKELGEQASPAKQLDLYREKYPPNVLANRFLKLAEKHPEHKIAISALGFIFQAATGSGDPETAIANARELAIDQVIERHLSNPDIVFFFTGLQFGAPSPNSESLLRAALDHSPHREVRAAACYELARFLRFKAEVPAVLKKLRDKPPSDDLATRIGFEAYARNLERFQGVDAVKTQAEAEQLLERVKREFADVPQAQFMIDGPGRVELSRYSSPQAKLKTYGALADAALFELRSIAVGKPAPDITGEEVDGAKFKLSDYHGKVIVLAFSGNWCGPCRAMYPLERDLVSRLKNRPFAMLSVNTDPDRETLRKSIQSGEITWRSWWDGGQDGPITTRWNILSFPTVFVIDAKGIIREIGLRGTELERAVDRLLAEATAPGKS
jgi:RNA polymerase sigma factor (sigma-70 family)